MVETSRGRSAAFPALRWSGHWIGPEPDGSVETPELGLGGGATPHAFTRVLFRKTFDLDGVPDAAPLRLTADSRYVLFANGAEVGRGPIRSQPRRLRFDEYDVARELRAGKNTIAVLVTYYGTPNAFWQPAAATGAFGVDALLVVEAKIGDQLIISDDSWQVSRSAGLSGFSLIGMDGVPVERVDARAYSHDWISGDFDDSAWPAAIIMKTSHIGGFGESRPPTDPYGVLLPRGVAALTGETITAVGSSDSSTRPS